MPVAGINSENTYEIIETTKAKDIHFSAKSIRKNKIQSFDLSIGSGADADNQVIQTCLSEALDIKNQLKLFV